LGHANSSMPSLVWKPWASPKCKLFSSLVIQNRVWMADRLEKRGWPNCGRCKLCNQVQETASHLLYKCWFTIRIWYNVKEWLGLQDVDPSSSHPMWRFGKTEMHAYSGTTPLPLTCLLQK
jgi:hypothetical protein